MWVKLYTLENEIFEINTITVAVVEEGGKVQVAGGFKKQRTDRGNEIPSHESLEELVAVCIPRRAFPLART